MADQAAGAPDFDPTPDPTPDAPSPQSPEASDSAQASSSTGTHPWDGSPWAKDLDGLEDGLTREQVHELWQSKVQPYVTQREQELGNYGQILEALNDPEQSLAAYLTLAEMQYGPEVAQHLAQSLQQYTGEEEQPDALDGDTATQPNWDDPDAVQAWYDQQPPWIQEQFDNYVVQQEDQQYEADLDKYAPNIKADKTEHIFARYVVATDGNVEMAKELYDREMGPYIEQARKDPALAASLGLGHFHEEGDQVPGGVAATAEEPPNVLGQYGAAGATVPPTEPQYASMDDVMDDFFETVRGQGGLQPGG